MTARVDSRFCHSTLSSTASHFYVLVVSRPSLFHASITMFHAFLTMLRFSRVLRCYTVTATLQLQHIQRFSTSYVFLLLTIPLLHFPHFRNDYNQLRKKPVEKN